MAAFSHFAWIKRRRLTSLIRTHSVQNLGCVFSFARRNANVFFQRILSVFFSSIIKSRRPTTLITIYSVRNVGCVFYVRLHRKRSSLWKVRLQSFLCSKTKKSLFFSENAFFLRKTVPSTCPASKFIDNDKQGTKRWLRFLCSTAQKTKQPTPRALLPSVASWLAARPSRPQRGAPGATSPPARWTAARGCARWRRSRCLAV